jgi:hypothetical protein
MFGQIKQMLLMRKQPQQVQQRYLLINNMKFCFSFVDIVLTLNEALDTGGNVTIPNEGTYQAIIPLNSQRTVIPK